MRIPKKIILFSLILVCVLVDNTYSMHDRSALRPPLIASKVMGYVESSRRNVSASQKNPSRQEEKVLSAINRLAPWLRKYIAGHQDGSDIRLHRNSVSRRDAKMEDVHVFTFIPKEHTGDMKALWDSANLRRKTFISLPKNIEGVEAALKQEAGFEPKRAEEDIVIPEVWGGSFIASNSDLVGVIEFGQALRVRIERNYPLESLPPDFWHGSATYTISYIFRGGYFYETKGANLPGFEAISVPGLKKELEKIGMKPDNISSEIGRLCIRWEKAMAIVKKARELAFGIPYSYPFQRLQTIDPFLISANLFRVMELNNIELRLREGLIPFDTLFVISRIHEFKLSDNILRSAREAIPGITDPDTFKLLQQAAISMRPRALASNESSGLAEDLKDMFDKANKGAGLQFEERGERLTLSIQWPSPHLCMISAVPGISHIESIDRMLVVMESGDDNRKFGVFNENGILVFKDVPQGNHSFKIIEPKDIRELYSRYQEALLNIEHLNQTISESKRGLKSSDQDKGIALNRWERKLEGILAEFNELGLAETKLGAPWKPARLLEEDLIRKILNIGSGPGDALAGAGRTASSAL